VLALFPLAFQWCKKKGQGSFQTPFKMNPSSPPRTEISFEQCIYCKKMATVPGKGF
ncbi:hypothetical protein TNCV_3606311, partial [Trichonephila clavipes]